MKGWHTLLPILFIGYGALIAIAIIDGQHIDAEIDKKLSSQSTYELTDHNEPVRRVMARLTQGTDQRVCEYYLSRRIGLRDYMGIVCVERMHGGVIDTVRLGRPDMSDEWYNAHVAPVVDSLKREYEIQYGW